MKPYRLIPNWRRVLTRAWSVRWMAIGGVLQIAEVLLTQFDDVLPMPRGVIAGATGIVMLLGLVARFCDQPETRQ